MHYAASETSASVVDHETLQNLLNEVLQPNRRVALIGWNETTKHLINLAGEHIAGVYDQEAWKVGITFRDVSVVHPSQVLDINFLAVCDYGQLYGFGGLIKKLYSSEVPFYYPPRIFYQNAHNLNVFKQDQIYTTIEPLMHTAPVSMMDMNKQLFLAELLRSGLKLRGNVIEIGVYQAGSVWFLAHILKNLGDTRHFYMLDIFETHMMHPNATMVKDEITGRLAFYPQTTLLEGLCDAPRLLEQIENERFCFVHYDLGFHPVTLPFIWERMQPGAPIVLDNYGHIAADPWAFDDFFAERGAHVIRNPWSEQGVVFKPC